MMGSFVGVTAIALTCSLLSVVPSAAQEQSGGIQGTVQDTSLAVLPGVTVEATGPAMPGVAVVVTDARGVYRFPALRPGVYTLTASLPGFTTLQIPDVVVRLGAEFRIDMTLELATVAESVTVTGESPVIDLRQNAAIATVTEDLLANLPAPGRDFTATLANLAGVQETDDGLLSIDGASSLENNYIVDGVKTNAIVTGENSKPVRMDFVEEIQVKSSGYEAEYGASMGGVINVVTKSGGDQLHGMAGTYFSDANLGWNGDYRPATRFNPIDDRTPETFIPLDERNTSSPAYEWLGDLGGPILRQRHWFYLFESVSHEPKERTVTFTEDPDAGPQTFTSRLTSFRTGFTVTSALTSKIRTRLSGQFDRTQLRRDLPSMEPDGVRSLENPAIRFDLRNTENRPSELVSANVNYPASDRFFMSSTIGVARSDRYDLEGTYAPDLTRTFFRSNVGLEGVPADLQFPSGYTDSPLSNSARVREQFTRVAWDLSGTYYGNWMGDHAIKAGLNAEWNTDDVFNGNTAPELRLYWNTSFTTPDDRSVRGPFGYYEVRERGDYGKITGRVMGLFVQDTWQPTNRLTINAGVRTEREVVPSYIPGYLDLEFPFGDKIAPRLGFALDLVGDARWKVYGSYGLFYDIMKMRLPRYHFGGEVFRRYFYSLDTPDWPSVSCTDVGPPEASGCPGTYFGFRDDRVPVNAPGEDRLDPVVKPSKTNEFVIGLDHELNPRTSVGVRYARKRLLRLVEDVGILDFTPTSFRFLYHVCNPGFGICDDTLSRFRLPDGSPYPRQPRARREYDALELRLTRRLSDNYFLNASYTWSALRGTTSGLASEDISQTNFPSLTNSYDTIFMAYDAQGNVVEGRMPNNRPHVFKVQGGYTMPWGTSLAVDYLAQSGELESTHISQHNRETFINNRGDLGRVDTLSRVNLRLQHEFELFGAQSITVALDVRNLFDQAAVTDIEHRPYRDGFRIPAEVYLAPGGLDLGAYVAGFRAEAGDPEGLETLRSNAFYRLPIGWQPRRTLQLSAKYRF